MGLEISSHWNSLFGYNSQRADEMEFHPDYYDSENSSDSSHGGEPFVHEEEKFTREWFNKQHIMEYTVDSGDNGIVVAEKLVPEEVLCLILSHLDRKSLLNCRLVCQRWKNLIDTDIWLLKLEKKVYRNLLSILNGVSTPFPVFYKVFKSKPFNRNLIKNSSGEEDFRYWSERKNGGDGWRIENPPTGADTLPFDDNIPTASCFATSFYLCSKTQVIDLVAEGLTPIILDELQPTIYISELYTGRFDCASTYTICVLLLNKKKEKIDSFEESKKIEQWLGKEWNKVEHEFKNYGKGVRYVKFFHSGTDNQFWKGYYGSKMSRACVKVIL